MKCYLCGQSLYNITPVKLISLGGEEVYVHEYCLSFIDVDNEGVIQE